MTRRPALGSFLILHGAAGIVLLAVLVVTAAPTVQALDALARSGAQVEATLATTRDAFAGFGLSLVEAKRSAERAAATARSSATTARQVADGLGVSIFGVQPLASLAGNFRQQGSDLEALAKELDGLAATLESNARDVSALHGDVALLYDRAAATGAAAETLGGSLMPLFYLLMAWLGLQAIAMLWLGMTLVRGAS